MRRSGKETRRPLSCGDPAGPGAPLRPGDARTHRTCFLKGKVTSPCLCPDLLSILIARPGMRLGAPNQNDHKSKSIMKCGEHEL